MMGNRHVFYIGMGTWDGTTSIGMVRIMSVLGKYNDLTFVNYPYTIKDVLLGIIGLNNFPVSRILGIKNRVEKKKTLQGHYVNVFTSFPLLSINFIKNRNIYLLMLRVNNWILRLCLKSYLSKNKIEKPIIIYGFNPFSGLFNIGELGESQNIYYCYDQIKAAKWLSNHGGDIEEQFIKKVDKVITTSRALYFEKRKLNHNCSLIQNGVDFELFNKAYNPIKEIKSNVSIGYIGMVDDRIDYNLLEFLLVSLPKYQFRMMGKVTNSIEKNKLSKFKNIEFTGHINYEEVTKYLTNLDICIIPFTKNEFTRNIYPNKINEYLAAGKPVISTNFADLREFDNIISLVNSKEAFLEALKYEVCNNDQKKQRLRIQTANNNSWEKRGKVLYDFINS